MAILKAKLKELRDADVAYISLVDRAATRIPFRVTKSDKEQQMINLSGLGRIMKGDKAIKAAPVVSGVVVFDNPDASAMASVRNTLIANGFAADKAVKNDDGTVLFAQTDDPLEDGTVVRVSDQMLVVVKGFDADTLRDNSDFADISGEGFFGGVHTAFDGIFGTVTEVLGTAKKADAKVALGKFTNYVNALVDALPDSVFKADAALKELVAKTSMGVTSIESLLGAAPLGSDGTQWSAMSTVDKIKWLLQSYTKPVDPNIPTPVQGQGSSAKGDKCVEPDADDAAVDPAEKKRLAALAAAQAAEGVAQKSEAAMQAMLTAALAPLVSQLQSIATKTDTQQAAIDEIARKSDTAIQAVKNTIATPASFGDTPAGGGSTVQKQDDDPRSGCFDTAFIARAQKREKRYGS